MNVTPLQNNSQSFGMAFKLKGDGAKKLATFLEETNSTTKRHIEENLIGPINSLKTVVVYDGKNVLIDGASVSASLPSVKPGSDNRVLQYKLNDGQDVYDIRYDWPQRAEFIEEERYNTLAQKLRNAREIAKDIDRIAAKKAYEAQMAAENAAKLARIEELAKKLQELYG